MILIDSGPMVALCDRADSQHTASVETAQRLPAAGRRTTWPCVTEAMHLLGRRVGFAGQFQLWELIRTGRLDLHDTSPAEVERMRVLMEQYQDLPMDLADASVVAMAEATGVRQVYTLDTDFYVYQLADGSYLDIIR